jgi:hypothetical protein
MTRKTLRYWVTSIVLYLIFLILLALYLSGGIDPTVKQYIILKDLIPLLLAVPTALLAAVLQRRVSFLSNVRSLYENSVKSVQTAIQYTHIKDPTLTEFATAKKELSTTIELFRGSFKNLREGPNHVGLYPFEALKTVNDWIDHVGVGSDAAGKSREARAAIIDLWKSRIRAPLLNELDRQTPTTFDSPYWEFGETSTQWKRPPRRQMN